MSSTHVLALCMSCPIYNDLEWSCVLSELDLAVDVEASRWASTMSGSGHQIAVSGHGVLIPSSPLPSLCQPNRTVQGTVR